MLLETDCHKVAALVNPMLDSPVGSVHIRERLKAFAAEEGLQL